MLGLGATTGFAQDLLLAICSNITPGWDGGTYWMPEIDPESVPSRSCAKQIYYFFAISPAPQRYILGDTFSKVLKVSNPNPNLNPRHIYMPIN